MTEWYREDLAYIHDTSFGGHALESAPGILEILGRSQIGEGLVVDLGCGSGLWARELTKARYRVLGIDISESMIASRKDGYRRLSFGSVFDSDIPLCGAVTAIGEVLNYLFDPANDPRRLLDLFYRAYDALAPGGVFVFDVAEPGQVPRGAKTRGFSEGEDWVVLVEKEENREAANADPPDLQLPEGGGDLQTGRRSTPSAVVRILGDCGGIAWSRLPGQNDAQLRSVPSAQGSRGIRRTQTGVRQGRERGVAEEV